MSHELRGAKFFFWFDICNILTRLIASLYYLKTITYLSIMEAKLNIDAFTLEQLLDNTDLKNEPLILIIYPDGKSLLGVGEMDPNSNDEKNEISFIAIPFDRSQPQWPNHPGKTWTPRYYSNELPHLDDYVTEDNKNNLQFSLTSHLSEEEWGQVVEEAAKHMSLPESTLKKVVLARSLNTTLSSDLNIPKLISYLKEHFPTCTIYMYRVNGEYFIGATPETLIHISDGQGNTEALAGTMPRGKTPEEDNQFAETLLTDPKLLEEHRVVVDRIIDKLKPFVSEITKAQQPEINRLANVMHLRTPISFTLRDGVDIRELVNILHPTPALAGLPEDEAMNYIAQHENMERGLFGGVFGYTDNAGKTARANVSIRGFRYNPETGEITFYVGAGIMPNSDPRAEILETFRKSKAMVDAVIANLEA